MELAEFVSADEARERRMSEQSWSRKSLGDRSSDANARAAFFLLGGSAAGPPTSEQVSIGNKNIVEVDFHELVDGTLVDVIEDQRISDPG